ncbi:MAG: serine hydrolase [Planctomycetes bacterium]|nr:serine hydrolase [Planctomycetota bacterium]
MILIVAAFCALTQDAELERVAQKIAEHIAPEPGSIEDLFHESFLKGIPAERVAALLKQLHTQYGDCTAELVADEGPRHGVIHLFFGDRARVAATIGIDGAPPHKITGLRFDSPKPVRRTVDDVIDELRKLRGRVSLTLARLGESPMTLADLDGGRPLAIGSTFKICILGALLAEKDADDPRWWARTVELTQERRSLGAGILDEWKPGTPLTLHSLALLMIARSDNTASDHLIFHVGRERVEAIAAEMGFSGADRNRPFLSTLEAFKLKASDRLRKQFLDADEAGRRKLLAGPIRELSRDALDFPSGPQHIDSIEWFASTSELCHAMDWLRRRTAAPERAVGRDILSVNSGLRTRKSAWKYVGYKGGSEPGVLNLTFLLQAASGTWYALSATWNDPNRSVDDELFADLVQDVVFALQRP